ncbi:MAG: cytochrome c3 family protein [Cyanobacteria bacterium P01_G01_bin.54]
MKRFLVTLSLGLALWFWSIGSATAVSQDRLDEVTQQWQGSLHAVSEVNCSSCHQDKETKDLISKPTYESCQTCHESETETFLLGKHGIRLQEGLSPLTPAMARIPMHPDARDTVMNCNTCHDVHAVNTHTAAVDACTTCHDDAHTRNYPNSPHADLFANAGELPRPDTASVTCATCHLPRQTLGETDVVFVNHNNTYTLLPRDRMVKDVCMNCHGLEHSYNSIFDDALVEANFDHPPSQKLESFDLVRAFEKRRSGGNEPPASE